MKAVLACVVLATFLAFVAGLSFDGPQCPITTGELGDSCRFSSQCKCGNQEVDFVFEFDSSGSMCDNLLAVKSGLQKFANSLKATGTIDYRFALLQFGGNPRWLTPWTTDVPFLSSIIDDIDCDRPGQESGFEMLRMVSGAAVVNTFNWGPNVSSSSDMSFRPGALQYHVLCTDEDSDCPVNSANRFKNPNDINQCTLGSGGTGYEVPNAATSSTTPAFAGQTTQAHSNDRNPSFTAEMMATASVLIDRQAAFAGWVRPTNRRTNWQYGPTAAQIGNFTFFDRAATIARAIELDPAYNKTLQIQLLHAGLTARIYDVTTINNAGAVEGFFNAIVSSVTCDSSSSCNCGRKDSCVNSKCVTNPTYSCAPFVDCPLTSYCKIGSSCAADGQYEPGFEKSCMQCKPYTTTANYSSSCFSNDQCFLPVCQLNRTCALIPRNATDCYCLINGTIYLKNQKDPNPNSNLVCDPRYPDRFVDPNHLPYDCSSCPASTECEIVTCHEVNGCLVTLVESPTCTCNIGGTLYRKGQLHPTNASLECDPQQNPDGWTDRASYAAQICAAATDCGTCLYQKAACGWCGAWERCVAGLPEGPYANTSSCPTGYWVFSESKLISTVPTPPYNPTPTAPLAPVQVEVFLRPGVPLSVPLKVRRPPIPPLDFYLLVDASATMGRFVDLIDKAANAIAVKLRSIQNDTLLGLGAFLDKPIQPRGFWPWCFVFKELVPLTTNVTAYQLGARNFEIVYNYDEPESSLEPLMLAAFDVSGNVGWRSSSYKVVMVATDSDSWEATDPNIRKIGDLPPNNGDGIADGWPPGTGEDYPSRDQVKAALVQTKVLPIFGTVAGKTPYYTSVVEKFKFGAVVPFSDQTNETAIADSIYDGINANLNKIVMSVESDPKNRVARINPEAGYANVAIGAVNDFEVVLLAEEGEEDYSEDSFVTLRFVGWPYTVNITIHTRVDCVNCNITDPALRFDDCRVCGGANTACRGCDGLLWSNLTNDVCGICDGDSTACVDCAGVVNGGNITDNCGVCGGDNSACAGCDGIPNSGSVVDDCGVCGGAGECNATQTDVAVAAAFAAIAAAFAIAAAIFFLVTRAKMMAVDSLLSKQLAAVRSNPLYQSKFKARENPLYRKNKEDEAGGDSSDE